MNRSLLAVLITGSCAVRSSTAEPNLIVNGSFEVSDDPGVHSRQVDAPNSTAVAGWTVAQGSIDICGDGLWPAAAGTRSIDINGATRGRIYQDVAGLVMGEVYRFSFRIAGNPYTGGDIPGTNDFIKNVDVSIGSTVRSVAFDVRPYQVPIGVFPAPRMGWRTEVLFYVAEAATVRVVLQSQDPANSSRGAAIDDVALVPAPLCAVDFNRDGLLNPDDLSDYIGCFFTPPCAGADFNGDGNVDPDDLSDYIAAFFAGCG